MGEAEIKVEVEIHRLNPAMAGLPTSSEVADYVSRSPKSTGTGGCRKEKKVIKNDPLLGEPAPHQLGA
jgi:hypothetical protein